MHGLILAVIGVSLLLGGLFSLRLGLKQLLSQKVHAILQQMTVTPWRGLLVGLVAAAVMQSSTTISLITITLVSANYLTFEQSLGIILGANIGTCTTVQIMAAVSIPEEYLLSLFVLGIFFVLAVPRLQALAFSVTGVTSLFLGLSILTKSLSQFSHLDDLLPYLLAAGYNPLYGLMSGVVITTLFQSSSAATGFLMVLLERGFIDIIGAAYIVYGNNIGSCIASVIVGAAAPLAAKRVAAAHVVLNVLGAAAFIPFTPVMIQLVGFISPDLPDQIALLHTLFNVLSSIAVMPFIQYYAKLIIFLVPRTNFK